LGETANENTIFGHVAPEQAALLVQALREQGQAVTMVGDEVNDVPAMRQANLAAARHSSSQAALSVAEIVLLKGSPKVLLDVLHKGQRIVNGLLDVLRLYLTQILYLTLLIVVLTLVGAGFPYTSKQGSILAIVTVSLPAVCLSLWAAAGVLPTKNLRWLLARIVVPAGITICVAGVVVYMVFLDRTGDRAYTQLALTHALVAMGLLLVLFLRPPGRLFGSRESSTGDWRFVVVVIVLFALFYLASWIPLADQFFDLEHLQEPTDYAIIGLVVLSWAVVLRLTLWAVPVVTRSDRLASTVKRLS
jgi:cation-transporting ATPase E